MNIDRIGNKLIILPDEALPELSDYIESLLTKYGSEENDSKKPNKFSFDWEGGLAKLKGEYTSVELQHKALDWR